MKSRVGHLKGPHTAGSSCRWDVEYQLGEKGAVYEFDIKLPTFRAEMTDEDFEIEAETALDILADALRARYTWIGQVGRAGRSGGWLTIEDKRGLATQAKLENIVDMVSKAKGNFIRHLEREYPR